IDRLGDIGDGAGGEGRAQHLALEADVEDTGPFGEETGKGGEDQRRRDADGGLGKLDEGLEEIHGAQAPLVAATSLPLGESPTMMRVMAGRNMCSSAPAKRITSP